MTSMNTYGGCERDCRCRRFRMPSSRSGASFLPTSKWNDAGCVSSMLNCTTGTSASGMRDTTRTMFRDRAQELSSFTGNGASISCTLRARSGSAGSRILHRIEFAREAAEIMIVLALC